MSKNLKRQEESWMVKRIEELGVTPQKLGDFVGVDRTTIIRYAKGNFLPKLEPAKMLRLCIGLNCTLEELVREFQPDKSKSLHELRMEFDKIRQE